MAESLGTIYYDVDANLEPLLGKMRQAESQLGGLGSEMKKTDRGAAQMQKSFDRTERSAASLGGQLNGLARAVKGVLAAMAIRETAGWVQSYQEMSERVRDATESVAEFELVQRRLQNTSNGTYRALAEVQEIYIQSSRALKNMGYETSEALDIVDSLSYAFVRNATSSDKAQSAMTALVRATNRGTVLTDHWASLLIAVPTILDDISAATGMTADEISALGYAGELTADMLTEGLRQSLDANKAAADGMANSLTDAGVRMKEAVTGVLFALEQQTGALQTFTNGIIAAADAMIEFGSDGERMAQLLQLAELSVASLAAVMTGRLVTSLSVSTKELYANTVAARAKAAAELQAAQTAAALAAQNLIQARSAERAAVGLGHHAQAAAALTAAENAATAATARLTAAQTAMAGAFSITTAAAGALRTALAFLGGPAGVILLVAAAFLTMGSNAKLSREEIDQLGESVSELGQRTLEYRRVQLEEALREQEAAAAKAERKLKDMERQIAAGLTRSESFRRKTKEVGAQMEEARARADQYANALRQVNDELERRASGADVGPQRPEGWKPAGGSGRGSSGDEFRRLEQSMKNQIELAKRTGLARAELAALQRLGADATEEEKARISELAKELYKLEQAQKKSASSTKGFAKGRDEAAEAAKSNAKALADLREQLYQTTLDADELVQRQAELTLNEYATPEQREQIRALALELRKANEAASDLARRKQAFGDDAAGAIRGQVSPLSGGMFDDQYARYEAEAAAEQERYAAQLERLREAKELEIEVIGGYQALEQQMAQEHAARMAQIDQARMQAMLAAGENGFGALSDIMKTAFGEQSAAYKVAFAAQKAFAIAQSMVAIQQGIAMAAANPWPMNLAAMASVASATAGLVADISSITMSGGRLAGGPVSAGRMYRVNENGAPEVFSAANGQQFMIPNQRGEVISNRNATTGGGGVVINIHNAPQGTVAESSQDQDGQQIIDIWVADFMADGRTASAVQGKFGLSPQGR